MKTTYAYFLAVCCAPLLVTAWHSTAEALVVSYTEVADTSTVIPAGFFAGQTFGTFTNASGGLDYAYDDGRMLFIARTTSTTADTAAFVWSDSNLQLLADASVPIPDRGVTTFGQMRYASTQDGRFAISTYDGIYATVGGVLTTVLDPSSGFTMHSAPAVDGSNVWFAGDKGGQAIFNWNGGSPSKVVALGQATPSAAGYLFDGFNTNVSAADNGIAFYASSKTSPSSASLRGIYTLTSNGLMRIADTTMAAPGQSGNIRSIDNVPISYDGQNVVFAGADANFTTAVYCSDGIHLDSLAITGQPAPGGGTFSIAQLETFFSVDGESIALSTVVASSGVGRTAIFYKESGGLLERVIGYGDQLFGRTIEDVQIGTKSLSGKRLAFWAEFTEGSSGLYLATIPEPASIELLCIAVVIFLARRPMSR